jgi:hypothetical protein
MADIRPDRLTTCQVRTEVSSKSTTKCISERHEEIVRSLLLQNLMNMAVVILI